MEITSLVQSNYWYLHKKLKKWLCYLPLDRESGRKRGFAFVDLNDQNSEQKAIEDLQDVEWMGREIRVNQAEKKNGPNKIKFNKLNRNN